VNLTGIRPPARAHARVGRFRTSTFDSGPEAEFQISMPTLWDRVPATLTTVQASS
jgi:hypothetical protein